MTRIKNIPLIAGIAGVLLLGAVVVAVTQRSHHMAEARATYYCPMHPGIVKDRPGDCPICYMKLVKWEEAPSSAVPQQQPVQQMKDICYMHNCPMVKPGQPCPMLVMAKAGEKVTCPICGTHVADAAPAQPGGVAAGNKTILYWTDPMIPGYTSDKPGKSPMGMDLIPVYEENGIPAASTAAAPEGYAPILVTPQKRQFIGVTTAPVQRRSMTNTIRTVGEIAHDPELFQAEQEYLGALKAFKQAQTGTIPEVTERAQRLVESSRLHLRHLGLSEKLIEEVATQTEPDHRLLLGDTRQLWVYAPIYEYELPLVREGQIATVDAGMLPGRVFTGTVQSIDPILDHMTRTARVRFLVENSDHLLKPAMYVNVSIVVEVGEVLAVPEEAIFVTGTKFIAFVDKGQGLFEPRDVIVGVKADGYYEVKAGVVEGELVVTSGNFLIDSESRLKAALQDMSGGGHQHGQ